MHYIRVTLFICYPYFYLFFLSNLEEVFKAVHYGPPSRRVGDDVLCICANDDRLGSTIQVRYTFVERETSIVKASPDVWLETTN